MTSKDPCSCDARMWFHDLFGFVETDAESVRSQFAFDAGVLTSTANGRRFATGRLELPLLSELRQRGREDQAGPTTLREVVADVQVLHQDVKNAGALFQVASQFNLLEMVGPSVSPEAGITGYVHDPTQGPACAIACGAGTVLRAYYVELDGELGQTAHRQIDCLEGMGSALGNDGHSLWTMQNGYCLLTPQGRTELSQRLAGLDQVEADALRGRLRVGVQSDVEVTLNGAGHLVTQVYGSALPVSYGGGRLRDWEAFARFVLFGSYEATLLAACANAERTGNRRVFLTLLGGGAFGNPTAWIFDAIEHALGVVRDAGLDVAIVSRGSGRADVGQFVERWNSRATARNQAGLSGLADPSA